MCGRAGTLAGLARTGLGRRARGAIGAQRALRGGARIAGARLLYACFCSRADVRRAASAPHGPDGPLYTGLCRDLTASEREERRSLGRQPSLRVRMQGTVEFRDDLAGPQRETAGGHERRHRPAAQRRRGGVPARGRRGRRGPGRHACRARSRPARLDGSSAPALRAARAGPRPGLRTRPAAARPRRPAAREAPRRRRARGAARPGRRPEGRSSAGSRTAPGCSSAPSPVLRAAWSITSTPPRCRGSPRASIQANCAGSLAAC